MNTTYLLHGHKEREFENLTVTKNVDVVKQSNP